MGALGPNAQNVPGTGENVGQLQKAGLSQQEIGQFGAPTPNIWQKLVGGTAQGLGQGLQSYGNEQNAIQKRPNQNFFGGG